MCCHPEAVDAFVKAKQQQLVSSKLGLGTLAV
jgi:hypothetical protein